MVAEPQLSKTPFLDNRTGRRRELGGVSRLGSGVALSGIILVFALLAGAAWVILDRRSEALAVARHETASLALALAEQTSRTFQAVDVVLMQSAEKIRAAGVASPRALEKAVGTRAMHDMLRDQTAGLAQLDSVSVVGADGRLLNSSYGWPISLMNVSDYFQALRASPDLGRFVSKPALGRVNGAWVIFLARRLDAPNGDFIGLVIAAIELRYFEDLYRAVSAGVGDSVSLRRRDGTLLARYPRSGYQIGESFGPSRGEPVMFRAARDGAETAQNLGPSPVDGVPRLRTVRFLKDFPLAVVVSRTAAAITAEWCRQAIAVGGGALLAAAALALAALLLARQVAAREASEATLAATLDYMSDGIMMIDSDRRVQACNRNAIEMLNLPADLMATRPLLDEVLQHSWEVGNFANEGKSLEDMLAHFGLAGTLSDKPQVHESRRPNGETIEIHSSPLPGGGVVRTYTDVTGVRLRESALNAALAQRDVAEAALRRHRDDLEREVAERTQALAASETRLVEAIEAVPEGFALFDAEDRLVLCNASFRELYKLPEELTRPGTKFEEMVRNKAERGLYFLCGKDVERSLSERLAQHRAASRALDSHEQQLADGRRIEIHERRTADGGIVGVHIDVTQARQRQAAEGEHEKLTALGHLAGGVAHEINNLLQPALTFPELLMDRLPPDDTESREDLQLVLDSVRKAREIVRGILLYARKQEPALTPLVLADEAHAALAFLRDLLPPSIVVVEKGLCGEALAAINKTQLTQVLTNLVVNAAHAMNDRGTITVTVDETRPDAKEADALGIEAGRRYLTLAVADTGHGMDAAIQKRIFEPFFTTKPVGQGTGLGLPVAYGILKSWKGAIGLKSAPGNGATFTLYIPAAAPEPAPGESPQMEDACPERVA